MNTIIKLLLVGLVVLCRVEAHAGSAMPGDSLSVQSYAEFTYRKQLPRGYELPALIALSHFPELKNIPIRFRIGPSFPPLCTQPDLKTMFRRKGARSYVIIISNRTSRKLTPILFERMDQTAQVGILGHELGHVKDFSGRTTWQSLKMFFHHFSRTYMDRLEFNTDRVAIEHGLGRELEAWSRFVRNTLQVSNWRGPAHLGENNSRYERYMNPDTIEKYISLLPAR